MAIQFPTDFQVFDNPVLITSVNYVHRRPNGSIISVLDTENKDCYEVWDQRYMEFPEYMTSEELHEYLQNDLTRILLSQMNYN
jgi:hypothetical protein